MNQSNPPANPPVRMLRRPEVERLAGLSRSTIYEMIERGEFPRPVKVSSYAVAWLETEIAAWQRERIELRDRADA